MLLLFVTSLIKQIRNPFSDKKDNHLKTCMTPKKPPWGTDFGFRISDFWNAPKSKIQNPKSANTLPTGRVSATYGPMAADGGWVRDGGGDGVVEITVFDGNGGRWWSFLEKADIRSNQRKRTHNFMRVLVAVFEGSGTLFWGSWWRFCGFWPP